jgi:hypothetical protein
MVEAFRDEAKQLNREYIGSEQVILVEGVSSNLNKFILSGDKY